MNIVWITADTLRHDQMVAYGRETIGTAVLDAMAENGARFDSHYVGGYPTMPTCVGHVADHWTMSFRGEETLAEDKKSLAHNLAENGYHTETADDTPFYIRGELNYDRSCQSFSFNAGQECSPTRIQQVESHDSGDFREC